VCGILFIMPLSFFFYFAFDGHTTEKPFYFILFFKSI